MLSSTLLGSVDEPDAFHMEMSERLRDFAHVWDENVDRGAAGELVFLWPSECICVNSAVVLQRPTYYIKLKRHYR